MKNENGGTKDNIETEARIMTLSEVVDKIEHVSRKNRQLVVCVDGLGGSGKSSLAEEIKKAIPGAVIIHGDDFFKPVREKKGTAGHASNVNEDFDWSRFESQVLNKIRNGEQVSYQIYDWHRDELTDVVTIPEDAIIIIEGGYTSQQRFAEIYDYKIWVEASEDKRLRRILDRDGEHMRPYWENDWLPVERKYEQEQKPAQRADLVLDGLKSDWKQSKLILAEVAKK